MLPRSDLLASSFSGNTAWVNHSFYKLPQSWYFYPSNKRVTNAETIKWATKCIIVFKLVQSQFRALLYLLCFCVRLSPCLPDFHREYHVPTWVVTAIKPRHHVHVSPNAVLWWVFNQYWRFSSTHLSSHIAGTPLSYCLLPGFLMLTCSLAEGVELDRGLLHPSASMLMPLVLSYGWHCLP